MALRLYGFFNSSASYRVRIALALKALPYEYIGVDIRSGEQNETAFRALNPNGLVPTLELNGERLSQSLAIIDRLDRLQPEPLLVPVSGPSRDRVLEIAYLIACDVHPLNNLRVLKRLVQQGLDEPQKKAWYAHWITAGFDALEALLTDVDEWCVGDSPTLADLCLVPQVANAQRMNISLQPWPRISRIHARAQAHPAFAAAAPAKQPDYIAP